MAAVSPLEPERLLAVLDERHVPGLSRRQLQVLAAVELGYTVDAIAAGIARSPATVRREIADLEHRVFDLTGLTPNHTMLAKWTRQHYACCTAPCLRLFKDRQVFDHDDHDGGP